MATYRITWITRNGETWRLGDRVSHGDPNTALTRGTIKAFDATRPLVCVACDSGSTVWLSVDVLTRYYPHDKWAYAISVALLFCVKYDRERGTPGSQRLRLAVAELDAYADWLCAQPE